MPSPYRDELAAALARAEEAERDVDRLEEELDAQRVERLQATTVESQPQEGMILLPRAEIRDQEKEIAKLRLSLARTRQKLDRWRRRRPARMSVNFVFMVIGALIGVCLEFVIRR